MRGTRAKWLRRVAGEGLRAAPKATGARTWRQVYRGLKRAWAARPR
jgi:hypothetical protein